MTLCYPPLVLAFSGLCSHSLIITRHLQNGLFDVEDQRVRGLKEQVVSSMHYCFGQNIDTKKYTRNSTAFPSYLSSFVYLLIYSLGKIKCFGFPQADN